ncbi:alpha/beta hydrolase [Sphingomonas donggukensis]|uniref:Alpha/beta hydrolase n=1 Tax=Sphingomonas donggukensis TaxID=2949093 RepID=A0ABY4U064_9SPHN|nr:alpha/beta hydrolase [Sphingomonas donggukensis]URW76176.1 alpha/beta hydrolase [Sphingomonas donggukensis]
MTIDRRTLLAASLAAVPASAAAASVTPATTIALWPGEAPGLINRSLTEIVLERSKNPAVRDRALTNIRRPRLDVFRPARPNGAAMLVIPGGGYQRVVIDKEGYEIGPWLAERGITAFVLFYRLPGEGWRDPANTPLADAQRAMRLIRARASEYAIDPTRVGAMGFSAGGHLCADLAVRHMRRVYTPVDAADTLDARPMLAAPIYPVVSMDAAIAHAGSRDALIGASPADSFVTEHSPDLQVTRATPPMFLSHAADDKTVPVANSIALHAALRDAGVPVEMHLFERGGHGFGWGRRTAGLSAHLWPELFLAWARTHASVR